MPVIQRAGAAAPVFLAMALLAGVGLPGVGRGQTSSPGSEAAPPRYTVTDLGIVSPGTDTILSVSDDGAVAGTAPGHGGLPRAFLWKNGKRTELPLPAGFGISVATAVAGDRCVGFVADAADTRRRRAVLWQGGRVQEVGTLGGPRSVARAVSSTGAIAGDAQTRDAGPLILHAFRKASETMTDLGTLAQGNFSSALGINTRGQVVGAANLLPDGKNHAFLYENGAMRDLGLLPSGTQSQARAINDEGTVVGWADTDDGLHAFLYRDGKMQDLGTLGDAPSSAWGVNERTQVVGGSGVNERVFHAFLWQEGKMTDLNGRIPKNAGWDLRLAQGINRSGQIVGIGRHKGQQHGFLLTPVGGGSS
jgi:probable HAF family extracellular repeat protein